MPAARRISTALLMLIVVGTACKKEREVSQLDDHTSASDKEDPRKTSQVVNPQTVKRDESTAKKTEWTLPDSALSKKSLHITKQYSSHSHSLETATSEFREAVLGQLGFNISEVLLVDMRHTCVEKGLILTDYHCVYQEPAYITIARSRAELTEFNQGNNGGAPKVFYLLIKEKTDTGEGDGLYARFNQNDE